MGPSLSNRSFALTLIADTGDRFRDFAPYVAAVNDHGVVAFQAALAEGGTGIFTGDGGPVATVADTTGGFGRFYSHPDIDNDGSCCVYAEQASGLQEVLVAREGRVIAATGSAFAGIGPLGPTMNDRGTVAFRADKEPGGSGVFTVSGASLATIADTTRFAGFHGLPVINRRGTVVFRADRAGGGQGIYASSGGSLHTIVDTDGRFARLGSFPCVNDAGTVVFNAILETGRAGIYAVTDGEVAPVVQADDTFESFRGALINNAGTVLFYATPRATPQRGRLGIYAVLGATAERLLALGDPLLGSTVTDFALNPVSVSPVDRVAIRVKLADHRQVIVRADLDSDP